MHCKLVIPGLVPPADYADEFTTAVVAPVLGRLFSRGRPTPMPPESYDAWLCRLFNIAKQTDWPLAPITLEADGGNAEDGYWLRADPVHLSVNRDQLILSDSSTFDITQEEAVAFSSALNEHFAADGLRFEPHHPTRWYLRVPEPIDLRAISLHAAVGKNINKLLPTGNDARRYRSLFNELQMLLFAHPQNEAREANGQVAINSVWFWGGGKKSPLHRPSITSLWVNESLSRCLAKTSATPAADLPDDAHKWLAHAKEKGQHLIVLDALLSPHQYGDIYAWQQALNQLEQHWFAPLFSALQRGKITQLTINGFGDDNAVAIDIGRSDWWKVWRRSRSLMEVLCPE